MENKNLSGVWIEELVDFRNLYLMYIVPGKEEPRITMHLKSVYPSPNVWRISRVIGDGENNNLSPEMENILEDKIDALFLEHRIADYSFNFWKNKVLGYLKRIGDVYQKHLDGFELNVSDIEFIYRLVDFWVKRPDFSKDFHIVRDKEQVKHEKYSVPDEDYISLGNSPDPRMDEIISQRDHKSDFEKLSSDSKLVFLKKHNFFEIKLDDPKLVIGCGKIQYASDELLKDPVFIRKFMEINKTCFILPYTKSNINRNKKLVLSHFQNLVTTSIDNLLMYVSPKLQDDADVVKLALMINGNNIKYASDGFKNDRNMVILALLNDCDISEENFPLSMLKTYPEIKNIVDVIELINLYSKIDDEEVKRVLSNNIVNLIKHSPPEIRSSYKIMKKAFNMNPTSINFANPRVQNKLRNK